MKKMPKGLEYWTPDEVAECLEGLCHATYARLWTLLAGIPEAERVPLGGDGSNGTIEYPPEPDAYPKGKMGAVWGKLTDEERDEIAEAYTARGLDS